MASYQCNPLTRSSSDNVPFNAASGRPKGKQYLQKY